MTKKINENIPYIRFKPKGERLTDEAWAEIVDAWENGLSDREAAFRASKYSRFYITEAKLKEIVASHSEVADLRDFLRTELVSAAKLNISKSISEGSISTSKWYLERKAADEFSSKASVAFEGEVVGLTMEEKQREIAKLLDSFDRPNGENTDDTTG